MIMTGQPGDKTDISGLRFAGHAADFQLVDELLSECCHNAPDTGPVARQSRRRSRPSGSLPAPYLPDVLPPALLTTTRTPDAQNLREAV